MIVVNDAAAGIPYASSTDFASFKGTYTDFQNLTLTSKVSRDEDVPYAGSATVNLSQSETGATVDLEVYRILAKVTLENTFAITGGPGRSNITLHNTGAPRFAPSGANNYDGTGTTQTTSGFIETIPGGNVNSVTWYVGENIQPDNTDIKSAADRNGSKAPEDACYIRISSAALPIPVNTTPAIGQEYRPTAGTKSFTYDLYLGKSSELSNFTLRRNTNYTLASEISGTLVEQEEIAAEDGRVTLSKPESGGLVIGCFGGFAFSSGTSSLTVAGSYTKMLLLEPNTSRSTVTDNVSKVWGTPGIQYQIEGRKYWDRTYIYNITTDGTAGGMNTATGSLYDYCYQLTLGNVEKGTWYVPTQTQLQTLWTVYSGIKENGNDYSAFAGNYWCCTEYTNGTHAWNIHLGNGYMNSWGKIESRKVRCVRDLTGSETPRQYTKVVNGFPVIDLTELAPLGCVLTSEEAATRRIAINGQIPSNTTMGGVGGKENGIWNAKMSSQFQVMCANHIVGKTDWATAYTTCKLYASEGGAAGQWRLPTQREMMMIWILHPQLLNKGGFIPYWDVYYWCCTESNATFAWDMPYFDGGVYDVAKTTQNYVRCVRDIVRPALRLFPQWGRC